MLCLRCVWPFASGSVLGVAFVALILLPGTASGAAVHAPRYAQLSAANGTWGIGSEAALPANAATTNQNVSINSISCASAGNCTAAGTYLGSSGYRQGLLLTETAGTWASGVEAKLPANAATNPYVGLSSISCASAGNCTAVGDYSDNAGNGQGLLLTQTSGAWGVGSEVTPPGNAGTNPSAGLAAVSCPSAGNCSAVGSYRTTSGNNMEALVLTETGGSWSTAVELSLPADAAATNQLAGLYAISCPSAGDCTAVGGYQFMSGADSWASQGLMASENAGSWGTGVEPSLPANAWTPNPQAGLSSVSCASAGNCTAVGNYSSNSPGNQGLLLTETAGSWSSGVEAALPANAKTSAPGPLEGIGSVSCASPGNCSAVGEYSDSSGNGEGLLLTQTAGSWATGVEAALPANAATAQQGVGLSSVSCPTAGNCAAVGGYIDRADGGEEMLVTEAAGSWATGTEVAPPSNGGPPYNLTAISCSSDQQHCSAAGSYGINAAGANIAGQLVGTTTTAPQETLTVSSSLGGTVTSSPAGIDCGSVCVAGFDIGSVVTLTPTPNANANFSGWTGGGCENSLGPCQVPINGATTVSALFTLKSFLVTVQKAGNGSGAVSSNPPGIDCGSSCAAAFNAGTTVTLSATPDADSTFTGWTGAGCSGNAGCQVTVGADTTVTATFASKPKPPPSPRCVVPKVKGKTLAAAKQAIKAHNCSVGKITHATSRRVKKGHVVSQRPNPGTRLKHGAKIALVISKGR